MATINRSNISNNHDKISVTINSEDYLKNFQNSLKNYSKNASVPGFRKGHVPSGMIKKMYGQSIFVDEVLRTAYIQLEDYLRGEKIEIFGQPLPIKNESELSWDYNNPGEYEFEFEIGIKPTMEITPLEGRNPITRYEIDITDDMVSTEIETIRKKAAKLEDIDAQNEDTNIIHLDFIAEGTNDEPATDVVEYGKAPEALKSKLSGVKVGDTFTFSTSDISNEAERAAYFKKAIKLNDVSEDKTYNVTVTKVANLGTRDLDESLYEEVFPGTEIKDESAFREELKKAIKAQSSNYADEKLDNDIFEMLVHESKLDLPESFLKRWMMEGNEEKKTTEQVEKEWPSFSHQLRWSLISDELIKKYGVSVTKEEIRDDIQNRVMAYFGMGDVSDQPWMKSYIDKMMADEQHVDETYRKLLMGRLFEQLRGAFDVTTQVVTSEEFASIQNKYHQH